ncbi:unnamed protein product [Scytosiphon promiscuus]
MEHYVRYVVPQRRSFVPMVFLGGLPEMSFSIMEYVRNRDFPRIAEILQASCTVATKEAQHLLFEFTCSNQSELGGKVDFAFRVLPRAYFETPEPDFLWAMAIGKDNALTAALLRDERVPDANSRASPLFVTHVVARGSHCPNAEKIRTLVLQALAVPVWNVLNNPPWVELIGTSESYGIPPDSPRNSLPARLFANHALVDSMERLGIITLDNDVLVWIEALDKEKKVASFPATVVKQEGRNLTVFDGEQHQEIDLMLERVKLDTVFSAALRYNVANDAFEKTPLPDVDPGVIAERKKPGQLSKHRRPFRRWEPPDDAAPLHLAKCAVSIEWLQHFINREDVLTCGRSTRDVTLAIIKPSTRERLCRYVDLMDKKDVGPATYFVSHRWGACFVEMVQSVLDYHQTHGSTRVSPRETAFVWLDVFAVNQHDKADDLALMGDVVEAATQTLLCVDRECLVLQRLWCVYEIWQTLRKGAARQTFQTPAWKTLTLQVVLAGDTSAGSLQERQKRISELWLRMSTSTAMTSRPSDQESILAAMKAVTTEPTLLDLQIMSALCNTGTFQSEAARSLEMPPWERADMGGMRENEFKDRAIALSKTLKESKSKD